MALTKKISCLSLFMGWVSVVRHSTADALNIVKPSATGAVGLVPSYGVLDLNSTIRVADNVVVRISANNIMNEHYFTKRPAFYPGPGVWSSDGRSFNCMIGFKV